MSATSISNRNTFLFAVACFLVILQFAGSYLALAYGVDQSVFFTRVQLNGAEFFAQFIITGAFLYALAVAVALLLKVKNISHAMLAIFFISLSVATLLAHDRAKPHLNTQDGFWSMFSSLITDRQPVLLLSILTILGAIGMIYYVIRAFFKVSFEGSGIQIKLPGQTMYYMAIFSATHLAEYRNHVD